MYNGAGEIRRYTCAVPVCLPSCSSVRTDVHAYILWAIYKTTERRVAPTGKPVSSNVTGYLGRQLVVPFRIKVLPMI